MSRIACRFAVVALTLNSWCSLSADEPWTEPTRTAKLSSEQKRWIAERKKHHARIDALQARDSSNDEAIDLLKRVVQQDLKMFGQNHDETAKSFDKSSRQAYYGQEFQLCLTLRENIKAAYSALHGADNWRVRSADFHLQVDAAFAQKGNQPVRVLYGQGWDLVEPGWDLYEKARYAEALDKAEKAAPVFKKAWEAAGLKPAANIPLARTHWLRGRCLTSLARFPQAEAALRDALDTIGKVYGSDHPLYADIQLDVARVHSQRGEFAQAEFILREVLGKFEKAFGYPQRDQASTLRELGYLYRLQGNLALSESSYRRAVNIIKETDEPYPQDYAGCLAGLTNICRRSQRLDEAETIAKEALEYARTKFGAESIDFGNANNDLGHILLDKKKSAEALQAYEISHRICLKAYGAQHWQTAIMAIGLGNSQHALGRDEEAEKLLGEALATLRRAFGTRHVDSRSAFTAYTAIFNDAIAKHIKDGNLDGLRTARKKLQEVVADFNGPNSWVTLLYRLYAEDVEAIAKQSDENRKILVESLRLPRDAQDQFNAGKREEGLATAQKMLTIQRQYMPAGSLAVTEAAAVVARYQHDLRQYGESEKLSVEIVANFRKLWSGFDLPPGCAGAIWRLGEYSRLRRDLVSAQRYFDEASEIVRRTLGPNTADYASFRWSAANARTSAGDTNAAEPILREVLEIRGRLFGVRSEPYLIVLEELVMVAHISNKSEVAESLCANLLELTRPANGTPAGPRHIRARNILGLIFLQAGKNGEALQLFRRCLEDYGKSNSTEDFFYSTCLSNVGIAQAALGNVDEAEPTLRESIEKLAKLKTASSRPAQRLVNLLEEKARRSNAAGKHAEVKRAYEQQVAAFQKSFIPTYWRTPLAQARLADAEAVMKLTDDQRGRLSEASKLIAEAEQLAVAGKDAEAHASVGKALAIRKELLGSEHFDVIDSLLTVADAACRIGQLQKAREACASALESMSKRLGADHPETMSIHDRLGMLAMWSEDYRVAHGHFVQSANAAFRRVGLNTPEHAAALARLGLTSTRLGELNSADYPTRTASGVLRMAQWEHLAAFNLALQAQAEHHLARGDYSSALTAAQEAARLSDRPPVRGTATQASAMMTLGKVLLQANQMKLAEEPLLKGVELSVRIHGVGSLAAAEALMHAARLRQAQKSFDDANKMLTTAAANREKALGREHPAYVSALEAQAVLAAERLDLDAAQRLLTESLAQRRRLNHDPRESLLRLAEVHQLRGDVRTAAAMYAEHAEKSRAKLLTAPIDLTAAQRMELNSRLRISLDRLLSLPEAIEPEALYGQVLAWKGSSFSRDTLLQQARGKLNTTILFRQWEELTTRLATLATRIPYAEERAAWYSRVELLTAEREQLESNILRLAGLQPSKALLPDDVKKSLPANAALVDFIEYDRRVPTAGKPGWQIERRLAAFVVRPGKPVRRIEIGAARDISDAVTTWRTNAWGALELLAGRFRTEADKARMQRCFEVFPQSEQLMANLIWSPLVGHLDGASTVIVSPDGKLALFPFSALPGAEPGTYVIEERAIVTIPSAAMLTAPPPAALGAKVIAFGGVDHNATPEKIIEKPPPGSNQYLGSTVFIQSWTFLKNTGPEADKVAQQFGNREGVSKQVFKGKEASENAFRAHASEGRWLHLAVHGFSQRERVASFVERGMPGGSMMAAPAGIFGLPRVLYDAGLHSGLALAGANEPNAPDEDDGIVWSMEAASRDWRGVELAVLSACDTIEGLTPPGEGIFGVQRAFLAGGARTVVGTFWPVEDQGGRLLMERFYQNLIEKKLPKAEALRQAQVSMMQEARRNAASGNNDAEMGPRYQYPFYVWATYVLSGDWR